MRDRPGPGTDNGFKVLVLVVGAVVGGGWVLHHPPATMMAGVGIAILIGIGGASLALLIFLVVVFAKIARWLRADGETRKSLRQARQIQKGWPRLSRQLGLATADPDHLVPAAGPGTRTRPFIWTPQIKVRADAYGVVVTAATLPRLHRGVWVKAADDLANAWGCVRVAVSQDRPGWVTLRAVRRDPLTEAYRYAPTGHPPAELERWMMGRDEYSADVWVRLADVPGICIAGLPGYGKTSLVNSLIARFAPSTGFQVAVVDGKGGADYEDLAERFFALAWDDLGEANAVFQRVNELRRRRTEVIRSVLGVKNFWHVGPCRNWPLVVLVVDEAHTFLAERRGDSKEAAALVAENRRLVEEIVKKGRSVGILAILSTQKTTGDAIPTAIRDVCPVALSFAQRTDEAAVAALGADIRQYPDANPVALQDPAYVGVASMVVQGRPGFTRVRTPFVSDQDAARICFETAGLMRDPADLLAQAIQAALDYSNDNGAAAVRGEDMSAAASAGHPSSEAENWPDSALSSDGAIGHD